MSYLENKTKPSDGTDLRDIPKFKRREGLNNPNQQSTSYKPTMGASSSFSENLQQPPQWVSLVPNETPTPLDHAPSRPSRPSQTNDVTNQGDGNRTGKKKGNDEANWLIRKQEKMDNIMAEVDQQEKAAKEKGGREGVWMGLWKCSCEEERVRLEDPEEYISSKHLEMMIDSESPSTNEIILKLSEITNTHIPNTAVHLFLMNSSLEFSVKEIIMAYDKGDKKIRTDRIEKALGELKKSWEHMWRNKRKVEIIGYDAEYEHGLHPADVFISLYFAIDHLARNWIRSIESGEIFHELGIEGKVQEIDIGTDEKPQQASEALPTATKVQTSTFSGRLSKNTLAIEMGVLDTLCSFGMLKGGNALKFVTRRKGEQNVRDSLSLNMVKRPGLWRLIEDEKKK